MRIYGDSVSHKDAMPTNLPPRLPSPAQIARKGLALKSLLVVSALFLASLVIASMEFYCSAPSHSLSETEASLRLAAR